MGSLTARGSMLHRNLSTATFFLKEKNIDRDMILTFLLHYFSPF